MCQATRNARKFLAGRDHFRCQTNLRVILREDVRCIKLACSGNHWQDFVMTVIKLWAYNRESLDELSNCKLRRAANTTRIAVTDSTHFYTKSELLWVWQVLVAQRVQ
jgi:hypothetical protein